MKLKGPNKLVKRAAFMAALFDLYKFNLKITWDDSSYLEQETDSKFHIGIDRDTPRCFLTEVMAHEIVHLKQYLQGDLEDLPDGKTLWKGKIYETGEIGSDAYFLAPWEMEARAYQEWCVRKWETRNRELQR
jgi:hypothetical protein